jgi:hypothetical protein
MKLYHYLAETGEFQGISEARESPLEPGVFLHPAHSTETLLPEEELAENRCWCWDSVAKAWYQQEDYRQAKVYDTAEGVEQFVDKIGPLKDNWTLTPKPEGDWDATWDGSAWVVSFETLRDRLLSQVRGWADETLQSYKADCSQSEIQTWDRQESGARALVADAEDTSADAEFVRQLASARGITTAELVAKIMRKVELYTAGSAKVLGRQQALEDLIWGCQTVEELRKVEIPEVGTN